MLLFGLDWRYRIHWPKNACDEETSTCGRGPDPQDPQDSTASIGWATGRTAQHWLKMFLLMVFQFVEHVALFQKLDTWIPQDPMGLLWLIISSPLKKDRVLAYHFFLGQTHMSIIGKWYQTSRNHSLHCSQRNIIEPVKCWFVPLFQHVSTSNKSISLYLIHPPCIMKKVMCPVTISTCLN